MQRYENFLKLPNLSRFILCHTFFLLPPRGCTCRLQGVTRAGSGGYKCVLYWHLLEGRGETSWLKRENELIKKGKGADSVGLAPAVLKPCSERAKSLQRTCEKLAAGAAKPEYFFHSTSTMESPFRTSLCKDTKKMLQMQVFPQKNCS